MNSPMGSCGNIVPKSLFTDHQVGDESRDEEEEDAETKECLDSLDLPGFLASKTDHPPFLRRTGFEHLYFLQEFKAAVDSLCNNINNEEGQTVDRIESLISFIDQTPYFRTDFVNGIIASVQAELAGIIHQQQQLAADDLPNDAHPDIEEEDVQNQDSLVGTHQDDDDDIQHSAQTSQLVQRL
jgi:hypothetical protein